MKCNICGSDLLISAENVIEYYDNVPKLVVLCRTCTKRVEISGYTETTAQEISVTYAKGKNVIKLKGKLNK